MAVGQNGNVELSAPRRFRTVPTSNMKIGSWSWFVQRISSASAALNKSRQLSGEKRRRAKNQHTHPSTEKIWFFCVCCVIGVAAFKYLFKGAVHVQTAPACGTPMSVLFVSLIFCPRTPDVYRVAMDGQLRCRIFYYRNAKRFTCHMLM